MRTMVSASRHWHRAHTQATSPVQRARAKQPKPGCISKALQRPLRCTPCLKCDGGVHPPTVWQVIVAGKAGQPGTQALLDAAHAAWAPDKALMLIDPTDPDSIGFWQQQNPEAWAMVEAHYKKAGTSAAGVNAGASAAAAAPAGSHDAGSADLGLEAAGVASSAAAADSTWTAAGEVKASEVAAAGGASGGLQPTAFVCQNYTCLAPTSSPGKLNEQLSAKVGRAAGGVKLTPVQL